MIDQFIRILNNSYIKEDLPYLIKHGMIEQCLLSFPNAYLTNCDVTYEDKFYVSGSLLLID